MPQQPQLPVVQVDAPKIDIAVFQQLEPEKRREFVGNAVYPLIQAKLGDQAGRVTGMIIDENVVDIARLLSDHAYFNQQVNEAYRLLVLQPAQTPLQSQ